ncbi:MAG: GspE/PulE family protein [Opitutales bacterium]|nr:GspE/PulE family protein [Opitutales bacterium]
MMKFDILDWLRTNKSKSFENEDEAFQYLAESGAKDGIFSELCIDGIYNPKDGYDAALLSEFGENYAKEHAILLLSTSDSHIAVATADPFDITVIDDIRAKFGKELVILLAKVGDIRACFSLPVIPKFKEEQKEEQEEETVEKSEEQSIDGLLEHIILEAIKLRASDIHFENNLTSMRVRNRIDGKLVTVRQIDVQLARALVSAIKLKSGLKIDETRLPQDGRTHYTFDSHEYDIRISVIPTIRGENIVMRLFNGENREFSLESIGLNSAQLECLRSLSNIENGLILISGPTGSGKTTTLYSLLKNISSPEKKVVTVEDPVEYKLAHVNQVAVNDEIGLTFSKIIRSLLRQAPNVIFIGEIRDTETAQAAMQAALTGHLVLSSIHSENADGAIIRLCDLGISDYFINSCVRAVIAQRLVRLKCTNPCHKGSKDVCPDCFGRGYFGRTGVFEILLNQSLAKDLGQSRLKDFGYLCKMEDSINDLVNEGKLFDQDRWLFE